MLVINILLAVFISMSVAAPIFMKLGWASAAHPIYGIYRQFCHQFAFRSWFLFGLQPFYPRQSLNSLKTYEQVFGLSPDDLLAARELIGNEIAGYKMAICQRDIAMYVSLLVFGMIFSFSKNKLKRIPFWIWLLLGVIPLGLDGLTQLTSTGLNMFQAATVRESSPLLRTLTGGLFGFMSAWYIFPSLEAAFWEQQIKHTDKKS